MLCLCRWILFTDRARSIVFSCAKGTKIFTLILFLRKWRHLKIPKCFPPLCLWVNIYNHIMGWPRNIILLDPWNKWKLALRLQPARMLGSILHINGVPSTSSTVTEQWGRDPGGLWWKDIIGGPSGPWPAPFTSETSCPRPCGHRGDHHPHTRLGCQIISKPGNPGLQRSAFPGAPHNHSSWDLQSPRLQALGPCPPTSGVISPVLTFSPSLLPVLIQHCPSWEQKANVV